MKKGVIYSRVSTNSQDVERQEKELTEYALRNDIKIVQSFTDVHTGKSRVKDRTCARLMFGYLDQHKIDLVLISEISRLGRSTIDVQNNIHEIVYERGLNLYVHQQGMNARDRRGRVNATFKLVTDVLANVAQMEREMISERVKSGLENARRKGKTLGRPVGSAQNKAALLEKYPKVRRELKAGLSLRKVAALAGVSVNTVRKVQAAMEN